MIMIPKRLRETPRLTLRPARDDAARREARSRGQSMVESAFILPILIVILAGLLEGGFALNAWLRVQTAARDATRFALDAGRPADITSLVLNKLVWMDEDQVNIYLIKGKTNDAGQIPSGSSWWNETQLWGGSRSGAAVSRQTIAAELGGRSAAISNNMSFVIVEVNYIYVPTMLRVLLGDRRIPMTSYAIIQQY